MPVFRPDISALTPYEAGRPIEEVARDHGIEPSDIVRLSSNESPDGPFPGVVEAMSEVLRTSNRYPDPDIWDLGHVLAGHLGIGRDNLVFGNGSVAILGDIATAVGGPGTRAVYGWPSFVMYRFVSSWSMLEPVEVPLTDRHEFHLDGLRSAIDDSTRVVFVCNPNNPTGTIRKGDEIAEFIDSVPEEVLVVIDEAYHEFVTDPAHRTALPLALECPNVVVLRTFSKIYSLAAHRIGYAVGHEETLREIHKAQAPLAVNQVAQAGALASIGQDQELDRRRRSNEEARTRLVAALHEREIDQAESQANFVYIRTPNGDSRWLFDQLLRHGVIIRPMPGEWARVTVGHPTENDRFLEALDVAIA